CTRYQLEQREYFDFW
nr:immunoglobulin heavy chain junction region [Macaca mulatta]MOV54331.1 immunoglobulin heavy chain junction region [Macaca mulatta]MOV54354.1 immunoglobulin heavy chain junction region [Macaca mulatta]MOV54371.1 immunoglobulin heavy chain junction region [Macaca mulatta]MOV54572.1 immunoglobulin heavy chain junction region [Macaca mulatta]